MAVRTREAKQRFCFVYKQNQPTDCSSSWESEWEKLISSEFWSVRLNIYMGNYFSVLLFLAHGNDMVPETIVILYTMSRNGVQFIWRLSCYPRLYSQLHLGVQNDSVVPIKLRRELGLRSCYEMFVSYRCTTLIRIYSNAMYCIIHVYVSRQEL